MFFKIALSFALIGKFIVLFVLLIVTIFFGQSYVSKFIKIPNNSLLFSCYNFRQEAEKTLEEFKEVEKLFRTMFGDEAADKKLKQGLENKKETEQKLETESECENHVFLIYFLISLIPLFGLSFWIWKDMQFLANKTTN